MYYASGWQPILLSLGWVVIGIVAFLIWARVEHIWPFGSKVIHEAYLDQASTIDIAS